MSEPVAIVGVACLLPGAHSPEEFWSGLLEGADHRVDGGPEVFGTDPSVPGGWGDDRHRVTATRGGFVTEPEIDLTGLRLPAEELHGLGKVVRWPLHVVRRALADAGLAEDDLGRTGLVLGNYSFPTEQSVRLCVPLIREAVSEGLRQAGLPLPAAVPTAGPDPRSLWPSGAPATVVADALGIGGPRLALDAACSSTLYALALARDYLGTGAADVVLAGAVCAPDPLLMHLSFSDLNAFPRNGVSTPFHRDSSGIVTGQGAGVLVLKRLSDAERDGDRIRAVIRSVGLGNDGAGAHLLSPNVRGQVDAYRRAYAEVDVSTVDYLECHATGTPLGDSVELRGITEFFGDRVPLLGSVKGNVGHLLTVAGFTSVLKVLLAMEHGVIPPTPGVTDPIRPQGGESAADRIVRAVRSWPSDGVRTAGVSAFGFGGTNAHVVLSTPTDPPHTPGTPSATGPGGATSDGVPLGGAVSAVERANGTPQRVTPPRLAVRGLGVRLGPVRDAAEWGRVVRSGTPRLVERPADRWYGLEPGVATPDQAGYVDRVEVDVRTYRIPPAELGDANPQHLLLFEAAEQALTEAGYPAPDPATRAEQLPPTRVAVVIAMEMDARAHSHRARFDIGVHVRDEVRRAGVTLRPDELDRLEAAVRDAVHDPIGANEVLSFIGNVMASRISSSRNLTGPSFTLSTDGTGGARALEVARLLLLDPTIDAVLVGGVELAAGAENTLASARTADGAAEVLGDGAVAIVLTRPSTDDEVTLDAISFDSRAKHHVDHVQVAGPVDLAGLAEHYDGGVLSAVVPLVGDTRHAGVLAGVAAVVQSLRHADLPPAPEALRDAVRNTGGLNGFVLLDQPRPWVREHRTDRRTAAVHAGTSSVRLSAGAVWGDVDWAHGPGVLILPLHGDTPADLAAEARACLDELTGDGLALVRDRVTRPRKARTAVLVAADVEGLRKELTLAARDLPTKQGDWSTPAGSFCAAEPVGAGKVAFVYPGAFTTYPGAGRDLFRLFPGLLRDFEAEADRPRDRFKLDALHPTAPLGLNRTELMRHESALVEDIPVMLAAGTNLAVLHTRAVRDVLGIRPDGGFGYSLGESSMLFALDVWSAAARDDAALAATPLFRDELRGPKNLVRRLWGLADEEKVWATHVVLAPADEVRAALTDRVYLTHVNTPGEVVIAGAPDAVKAVVERLGAKSAKAPANHVMHCSIVDGELDALAALNDYPLGSPAAGLELLSAYDYDTAATADRAEIGRRIARTLCTTIDFARLATTAHDRGFRYFVEVGPGATCTRWIGETLRGRPHVAVSLDRRGASTATAFAAALARLVSHGADARLDVLFGVETPVPPRFRHSVAVGGESVVRRAARAAAPFVAARTVVPVSREDLDVITVHGEPFVYLPVPLPQREPQAAPEPAPVAVWPAREAPVATLARTPLRALGSTVAQAHRHALRLHDALLDQALRALETGGTPPPPTGPIPVPTPAPRDPNAVWDEADLLEFAQGKVANVFGPEFAVVDTYPVRVRLPEPPYLFVSRVTDIKARTGVFEPSTITTEYDIPADAWYLVDGLAPCAVTIEAGQCDLLLVAYLGIDFRNEGRRAYRLLDSKLVFHGGLPRAGQTLRYDIRIDRFVWNGDTLLFFFNYKCYADGELILELLDACAGFFSPAELDDSLGVVTTEADRRRRAAMTRAWFTPLERTDRTSLSRTDLELLAAGRPGEVFGPRWDQTADGSNRSLRLPGEMLRMVDEITAIDRLGGPRGLGELTAVKHLDPDGWYFRCHFTGDPVLAGSLVAEGGVQLLQVYAMYLGLHLVLPDAEFQSVPGLHTEVKVRGQITPSTPDIRYHVEITDVTLLPRPTVIADIVVYDGDKPIISMRDFGIRVSEKPGTPYRPGTGGVPPFLGRRNHRGEVAFINELHLSHAAKGDLATAMGPEFEIYANRRAPYIPNGDFRFVDRIMRLDGTRGVLKPGARMETEYDCPPEAWYFHENSVPQPVNAILMESSLQAAILLGYYLGATLASPDEELSIRNLDGQATYTKEIDLRGRTVRHRSEMLSSQAVPGATLQKFRYELSADDEVFYVGESLFGYFSAEALANQVGLDGGKLTRTWLEESGVDGRTLPVRTDDRWFRGSLRLSDGHTRLVDSVDLVVDGGVHGKGYARGTRKIDHDDWYFFCHFHRDPVMPGSLGVEAVIQALQVFAIEAGLGDGFAQPAFGLPRGVEMGWKYRGQVLRTDAEMAFELHVKDVRREGGRVVVVADASVWRHTTGEGPGLRIYELTDVAVQLGESEWEDAR
ncbi:beta-ketoacyl synthase N-terminal-like domain-containing protein [Actinosynnema sp. NPDC020468]|uniref:beta-ketoacyl synthase N-terminal-like domain-containing protein n=1 Tax=Actinosynnema sp. NPDC020468 TaxID=3154488 RepID=UPI0033D84543